MISFLKPSITFSAALLPARKRLPQGKKRCMPSTVRERNTSERLKLSREIVVACHPNPADSASELALWDKTIKLLSRIMSRKRISRRKVPVVFSKQSSPQRLFKNTVEQLSRRYTRSQSSDIVGDYVTFLRRHIRFIRQESHSKIPKRLIILQTQNLLKVSPVLKSISLFETPEAARKILVGFHENVSSEEKDPILRFFTLSLKRVELFIKHFYTGAITMPVNY